MSVHFSPDQPERRSRTGLFYVSAVAVHGAAAKDSALSAVVRVTSHVRVLCVCACACMCVCVRAHLLDAGSASLPAKPTSRNSSSSSIHGSGMERPLGSQAAPGWASATAKKKPWSWNPQASATHNFLNIFTFTTSELDMLVLI